MNRRTYIKAIVTLPMLTLINNPKEYSITVGYDIISQLKEDGLTVTNNKLKLDTNELEHVYNLADARDRWNIYEHRPYGGHYQAACLNNKQREQYLDLCASIDDITLSL